jgi:hypothetical protein
MTRDQLIDKYVARFWCGPTMLNQDQLASFLGSFADELGAISVEKQKERNQVGYWKSIAKKLREIWPPGEKDGKYPWRDSVDNIAKRLQFAWLTLVPDRKLDENQVLTVARKYVSQFQDDNKYMRTLKYFILKQDKLIDIDGKIHVKNSSMLINMLESEDATGWFVEDSTLIDNYSDWEGEVI